MMGAYLSRQHFGFWRLGLAACSRLALFVWSLAEMIRGVLYSPNPMEGSHSVAQAGLVPASQVLGLPVSVTHTPLLSCMY